MPDRAQVIIRIVPGGGTKTLQQIINQLEYLSRKGRLGCSVQPDISIFPCHRIKSTNLPEAGFKRLELMTKVSQTRKGNRS